MLVNRTYFIMNLSCSCTLALCLFAPLFTFGQTESQLRDPEYLIEQYNQLVAKHNALIEKTRGLIASQRKPQIVEVEAEADDELRQSLNDALAQVATLENQLGNRGPFFSIEFGKFEHDWNFGRR